MVSFKFFSSVALVATLSSTVFAHKDLSGLSDDELISRSLAARDRHLKARSCSSAIAAYNAQRKAKRALKLNKRQDASTTATEAATGTGTTSSYAPSATAITNNTCITAPEVTEGPYYINNEFVRQDMRESQEGITLTLDLGIMDTSTCTPLGDAFVEIWSANATGYYAGFGTGSSGGGGEGGGGMDGGNMTMTDSLAMTAPGTESMTDTAATMTGSAGAMPSGGMQGNDTMGGGGGGGGGSSSMPYNETFSRGGWATNSEGLVEFLTTFPGFYTGRTIHIHMMVHTNYSIASNGTIISHAGSLTHIGQIFFDDDLSSTIMNTTAYLPNQNSRTLNDADSILTQESTDGNDAIADASLIVEGDPYGGVYAYITVGVDSTASYSITSSNYNLVSEAESTNSSSSSSSDSTSSGNDAPAAASWSSKLSYVAGLLPLAGAFVL